MAINKKMDGPRAILRGGDVFDSVPLESTELVCWKDSRTGESYRGYMIDLDALTNDDLHVIYQDMKQHFPDVPCFDSWVQIVKMEGMPIRQERISAVCFDLRKVV